MVRGERPIKLRDSWFSPKCIWVQRCVFLAGGRALDGLGALPGYRCQLNSECRQADSVAVRLWGISFMVERETARIAS